MRIFRLFKTALICCAAVQAGAPRLDVMAKLPLSFEPAPGSSAHYIARGPNYVLDVGGAQNVLTWLDAKYKTKTSVRIAFLHTRPEFSIGATDPLPSHTNYFIGRSPENWRTNVTGFGKVRMRGIYSGIDLVFYGTAGQLEYDFVVRAGADPKYIEFDVAGADDLSIDKNGDLVFSAGGNDIRWKAPMLYQTIDGKPKRVEGAFALRSAHRVGFQIGAYDTRYELTIDPVLSYTSYLGGSSVDIARGIATDSQGNVYLAGGTDSMNLGATMGVFQTTATGPGDAFVAKFSPSGALVYLTYIGGKQDDFGISLAVDPAGNAYLTGKTSSTDFPVTSNAFQKSFQGTGGATCKVNWFGDAFVVKLNPSGSQLVYSTYLGGSKDDFGSAIAIDSAGNAYVTGFSLSTDFPTTSGVFQTDFQGYGGQVGKPICNGQPWFNSGDAFVAKLNPAGTQLVFSTYLGGSNDDFGTAITVDSSQNVYVGGFTLSRNFPVSTGALQTTFRGIEAQNFFFHTGDGFVAKLNSSGSLSYATYLGGAGDDIISGLRAAPDGSVWISGATSSLDFPVTSNALQKLYAGYTNLPFLIEQLLGDGFVTHLNATGTGLVYSTYLGGSQNDIAMGINIDSAGLVYVVGFSESTNFPVTADAVQKKMAGVGGAGPYFPVGDGFVTVIDPASSRLVYSTYLGGSRDDQLWGLALDGSGGLWATGNTLSTDLPVTSSAAQKQYGGSDPMPIAGGGDAILVHFTSLGTSGPVLSALTNAASNAAGVVSPGMIFTLYGSGMGPAALVGASLDSTGKLAPGQAGVTVTFDGVPAPIVYVSATQVAGVAPYSIAGKSSTQVVVHYNSQDSTALAVPVVAAAPGVFSSNFSGTGTAVAFNQDSKLNTSSNPAAKGSAVVLFGTGEGQTNPQGVDGKIAVAPSLPVPQAGCTATVGNIPATVLYCGAVPGVVSGEFQLNLQLSPDTPAGSDSVVISIGAFRSQANLTIFVQ
jgi:uncharacterized protein (TIGR03437 family)